MKQFQLSNLHHFKVLKSYFIFNSSDFSVYKINKEFWDFLNQFKRGQTSRSLIFLRKKFARGKTREVLDNLLKAKSRIDPSISPVVNSYLSPFSKIKSLRALGLYVCTECNFNCFYCSYRGMRHNGSYMSEEVAKRAINFAMTHSGNNLQIVFYGGEPLLNFSIIKFVVGYAVKLNRRYRKNLSFSVTTNGSICNKEIINFLKKHKFEVLLSIDGPKNIHDQMRCFKNNCGSHSKVLENLKKYFACLSRDNKVKIISVISPQNVKKFNLIYSYFLKLERKLGVPIGAFSLVDWRKESDCFKYKKQDLELFKKAIEKCAVYLARKVLRFNKYRPSFDPFNLMHFVKVIKKGKVMRYYCSGGISGITVLPNGDLLPCASFYNNKQKLVFGNILNLRRINENLRKLPYKVTSVMPQECLHCWMKNFCGANCPAYNYYYFNNYRRVYKIRCEIYKKRFEAAVWILNKLGRKVSTILGNI